MPDKMKMLLILGIGIIIIAVTLVIFLIGFSSGEKTTLHWLSLLFVLISEVALIGGLILMRVRIETLNATLLKAGITSTLFIYFVITVLLAVFKPLFAGNLNAFITIQVTMIGIAAAAIMALLISASTKA